jgi:hypothetical protein
MKFREQITQPGLVIDLLTIASIISVGILGLILFMDVLSHILYQRGSNWHNLAGLAACYALVIGAKYLWKHRNSTRV